MTINAHIINITIATPTPSPISTKLSMDAVSGVSFVVLLVAFVPKKANQIGKENITKNVNFPAYLEQNCRYHWYAGKFPCSLGQC